MCFYFEPDWYASQIEDTTAPATKTTRCHECHQLVHPGEPLRHVYQQEREDGEYCQPDRDEHVDGCDKELCENDGPGETYDWYCCERCGKLLQAIQAKELSEGCGEYESQPALGELSQAMFDDLDEKDGQYFEHARETFPELAWSGHLDSFGSECAEDLLYTLAYQRSARPEGVYAGALDTYGFQPDPRWAEIEYGGEG